MFSGFKKKRETANKENLVSKLIPLIVLIPILYLFLFVGRMEALTAAGASLFAVYVAYAGTQLFMKAKRRSRESREGKNPTDRP